MGEGGGRRPVGRIRCGKMARMREAGTVISVLRAAMNSMKREKVNRHAAQSS
ncbi:hypothetical protein SAMN05216215_103971 [Saccharopolyspora shandongensis]|uniref:Uncharacterized protein n=1 Tax=Saccharopolyspora shandongensis TaxID=418495 RepID=A0A1H3NW87_9PSEU|nr:hypothetical protein SAMN05216215_103971 [Saccharopolyspora shandongensis]